MTALGRALGYSGPRLVWLVRTRARSGGHTVNHTQPLPTSPYRYPGWKELSFTLCFSFFVHKHTYRKKNVFYKIFSMMHNKQNQKKYKNMKNKNHPLTYHLQMFTETLVQIFLFFFFLLSSCWWTIQAPLYLHLQFSLEHTQRPTWNTGIWSELKHCNYISLRFLFWQRK